MVSDLLNRVYYVLRIMNYTQSELAEVIKIHYKIDFDKAKYKTMIELQVNLKDSINELSFVMDKNNFELTGIQTYYTFLLDNKEHILKQLSNVRKERNEKR